MEKSMTALISAFVRAYHAGKAGVKVFDDSAARQLLGEEDYERIAGYMAQAAAFFDPGFRGTEQQALDWVMRRKLGPLPLGRAAFAENALKTEIAIGARQYVILGAGYDSFIYRRPDWAEKVRVFQVDRPGMLDDLKRRAEAAGLRPIGECAEIPADLSQPGWSKRLAEHPLFSRKERTFVSMLGLSYYLEREAMEEMLTALGNMLPEGSALAFDYMDAGGSEDLQRQGMLARAAGEPMRQGYDYDELEGLLSGSGFLIYEHLTPEEMEDRFFWPYILKHLRAPMHAMQGVNCCLAVRKRRK